MENIILNNNLECPVIGIGTFMLSLWRRKTVSERL